MTIDEFLEEFNLQDNDMKEVSSTQVIVRLDSSDDYADVYSKIDNNNLFTFKAEDIIIDTDKTSTIYTDEDNEIEITLSAEFTDDNYLVKIKKINDSQKEREDKNEVREK